MFQRRTSFSHFTEEARRLSEGVVDSGAMHFKAKLCGLRERWNELFEKARKSETTAEVSLKPLNEYQEVFEEFTSRFEELEEKLEAEFPPFESCEEVANHIEEQQVRMLGSLLRYRPIEVQTLFIVMTSFISRKALESSFIL